MASAVSLPKSVTDYHLKANGTARPLAGKLKTKKRIHALRHSVETCIQQLRAVDVSLVTSFAAIATVVAILEIILFLKILSRIMGNLSII